MGVVVASDPAIALKAHAYFLCWAFDVTHLNLRNGDFAYVEFCYFYETSETVQSYPKFLY